MSLRYLPFELGCVKVLHSAQVKQSKKRSSDVSSPVDDDLKLNGTYSSAFAFNSFIFAVLWCPAYYVVVVFI